MKQNNIYSESIIDLEITDDNYYADDRYMSQSMLSYVEKSMRHYIEYVSGNIGNYETEAMKFGTAYHHFVLEPETFDDVYFILDLLERPEPTRSMNLAANKRWKEDIMLANVNKQLINSNDFDSIKCMAKELSTNNNIQDLFVGSEFEKIILWKNRESGVLCKGKIDIINEDKEFICDLKTCQTANPKVFKDTIVNRNYHRQAAFYLDAVGMKDYYIIAQEKVYPFAYCTYKLSDELIEEGRKEYQMLLNKFKTLNDGINFNHYNNGKIYEV